MISLTESYNLEVFGGIFTFSRYKNMGREESASREIQKAVLHRTFKRLLSPQEFMVLLWYIRDFIKVVWECWGILSSLLRFCFPGGSEVKVSACNMGDLSSIPGLGRSPGEGNGNPLQYSCLENPMDGGAWWATVHRSQRVGQDWATSLHLLRFEYCKGHTMGFSDSSVGKEFTCMAGDTGSIPGLGRSTEEVIGYPLQYSGLENSMGTRWYGDIYGWLDKWENLEKTKALHFTTRHEHRLRFSLV